LLGFIAFASFPFFKGEYHAACPFKVTFVLFPRNAALAMLQADELLNHRPATFGASLLWAFLLFLIGFISQYSAAFHFKK
jgi:hypothetical protein